MKTVRPFKYLLTILALIALATPGFAYELKIHDAPNWVNDGTIYTSVQGERNFYGVGSSPVVGDPDLQKAISKSRAKSEATRIFSAWLDALADDYVKSTHADKTVVKDQLKSLGDDVLAAGNLAARWRDPRTGSLYSLLLLDMTTVKRMAAESRQIDAALRAHIRNRGDKLFDSVAKSSRKRPHRP